jgi:uncharacterized protein YdaU (DUF1376 family)
MSARPWYKRYPSDFIAGTIGLTAEEKGVYSTLIDLMYDRGAELPDDPRHLARLCGCSTRRFGQVRDHLVSLGKLTLGGGLIGNNRFAIESRESQNQHENLAKNARKSHENRAKSKNLGQEKTEIFGADDIGSNGLASNRHISRQEGLTGARGPEARSQKPEAATQLGRAPRTRPEIDAMQVRLFEAAPELRAQAASAPGLLDLSAIIRMLDAGYDLDQDVLPAIAAYMARPRRQLPRAWGFFEAIIREHRERRPAAAAPVAEVDAMMPRPPGGPWVFQKLAGLAMWRHPSELSTVHWEVHLRNAQRAGKWPEDELGPEPGQPGCMVPEWLLQPPEAPLDLTRH